MVVCARRSKIAPPLTPCRDTPRAAARRPWDHFRCAGRRSSGQSGPRGPRRPLPGPRFGEAYCDHERALEELRGQHCDLRGERLKWLRLGRMTIDLGEQSLQVAHGIGSRPAGGGHSLMNPWKSSDFLDPAPARTCEPARVAAWPLPPRAPSPEPAGACSSHSTETREGAGAGAGSGSWLCTAVAGPDAGAWEEAGGRRAHRSAGSNPSQAAVAGSMRLLRTGGM